MKPDLTAERFDSIVAAKPEKLWGAPSNAAALGVSVDKVRALATKPGVPIYKPVGAGYFAYRTELDNWLRHKPANYGGSKSVLPIST